MKICIPGIFGMATEAQGLKQVSDAGGNEIFGTCLSSVTKVIALLVQPFAGLVATTV